MSLFEAKLQTNCVVKSIIIEDEKTKIRLMELGLIEGTSIQVKNKSLGKKTLLVCFNQCCFTLKENIAKQVLVNYA